jgi:hypothetical protein
VGAEARRDTPDVSNLRLGGMTGTWKTEGWTTDASAPADLVDALHGRLNEADALALGRVLRALAHAGLIVESHVVVRASSGSGRR